MCWWYCRQFLLLISLRGRSFWSSEPQLSAWKTFSLLDIIELYVSLKPSKFIRRLLGLNAILALYKLCSSNIKRKLAFSALILVPYTKSCSGSLGLTCTRYSSKLTTRLIDLVINWTDSTRNEFLGFFRNEENLDQWHCNLYSDRWHVDSSESAHSRHSACL